MPRRVRKQASKPCSVQFAKRKKGRKAKCRTISGPLSGLSKVSKVVDKRQQVSVVSTRNAKLTDWTKVNALFETDLQWTQLTRQANRDLFRYL